MNLGLKGRHALITGGSHGIGLSTALALAKEGCHVAICARDAKRLAKAEKELRVTGVKVFARVADAVDVSSIDALMREIVKKWSDLNILVNNVGGGGRWGSPSFEKTSESVWKEVYEKNVMAAVRFTKFAIPFMRKQKWGRVVTISSIYGKEAGGRPWFNAAKSAEISLMKCLSRDPDLARTGITFNSVAPGAIMIPDTGWALEKKKSPRKFKKELDENHPMGRLGTPEEVANVVTFLCSQPAQYINGASIVVDGGQSYSF